MPETAVKRPGLVTVVAVLTVVAGVVALLAGFVWLFLPPQGSSSDLSWRLVGIGYLACGIGMILVARGLLRGDPRARTAFVVLMALNVVLVVAGAGASEGSSRGLSFLDLVLIVVAVAIVYTPKANAFFGGRRVTAPV